MHKPNSQNISVSIAHNNQQQQWVAAPNDNNVVASLLLGGKGIKRMMKSINDVFSPRVYSIDGNDGWFEEACIKIEDMDELLGHLLTSIESMMEFRRDISAKCDQLGKSLKVLVDTEEHDSIKQLFIKHADLHGSLAIAECHKAEMDFHQLVVPLKEQLRLTGVLKEVFFERVKCHQKWQNMLENITKKRESKLRLELAGKGQSERADECVEEIEDCEARAEQLETEFENMSDVIRNEYHRYFKQRREDIKRATILYMELLIDNEQRVLSYWEKLSAEKLIDE